MLTEKKVIKWQVCFELEERGITNPAPTSRGRCITQREITHIVARAIGSIQPQVEGLQVTDYHILCNDKEQPEAACLELTKQQQADERKRVSRPSPCQDEGEELSKTK